MSSFGHVSCMPNVAAKSRSGNNSDVGAICYVQNEPLVPEDHGFVDASVK